MGWNEVRVVKPHPLLEASGPATSSTSCTPTIPTRKRRRTCSRVTDYEIEFACALGRDNLFAMQFHPEKSGRVGLDVLERFARWDGTC